MCIRDSDGTTGLADLLLSLLADPAGLDDAGGLEATVTEELGVSVGEEVDDGDGTPYSALIPCLLYTSDAADEEDSVDLGGRRILKKKKKRRWRSVSCLRRRNL
eukprot:TRINITY_DN7985_c0_g1_i2.p2 TRINITY_DN7985_c0_g1~~TRINITY_DN7985_c0_g1_i2.p2  ORF type:complete len:104 (-),score=17.08 TRINITY_DN7985_c0_g1_i2:10-321(-)